MLVIFLPSAVSQKKVIMDFLLSFFCFCFNVHNPYSLAREVSIQIREQAAEILM